MPLKPTILCSSYFNSSVLLCGSVLFSSFCSSLSSRMYRTASTARISDEFSIDLLPVAKISQGLKSVDDEKLELYISTSHDTKKEASSLLKSPWENAVHLIPLFVIICFVLLWLCSHPVNLVHKPELTVERVGGLNINGHGNQIGLPSSTKLKDLDQLEHTWDRKPLRTSFDE